jgi:hypothetical protein
LIATSLTGWRQDAGINVLRISFIRVRRESHIGYTLTRELPAEEVWATFTRANLETGQPERPMLAIAQRAGGAWR